MRRLPTFPKWLIVALLGAGLAIFGLVGYARSQNQYTIFVDGETRNVRGTFASVEEVLTAAQIPAQAGDWVNPPLDQTSNPTIAIEVKRAKTIEVITEQWQKTYTTHQPTLGAFLTEANLLLNRTDQIKADGIALAFEQISATDVPAQLEIGRIMTVTVQDSDKIESVTTGGQTVGDALEQAGIRLFAADGVEPAMGSWLTPGMQITVKRSKPLTIRVDGRALKTRSHQDSSLAVLAEAGIGLVGYDYVVPAADQPLQADAVIQVIRVTEDFIIQDEPIPFETLRQPTDQLEIDSSGLLVQGKNGIKRTRIRVRYENGTEVSRAEDGVWVAADPVNEIVGYGTNIVIRTLETPSGTIEYWRQVRMRVTSYTAATSGKTRDHPAYGITASGVLAGYGVVAVDKSVVPFRTNVYVPDYGVGFAGDTGGGIIGRWIDLGYDEDSLVWWRGYTDVYYLTPVPEPERINYLIPTYLP